MHKNSPFVWSREESYHRGKNDTWENKGGKSWWSPWMSAEIRIKLPTRSSTIDSSVWSDDFINAYKTLFVIVFNQFNFTTKEHTYLSSKGHTPTESSSGTDTRERQGGQLLSEESEIKNASQMAQSEISLLESTEFQEIVNEGKRISKVVKCFQEP